MTQPHNPPKAGVPNKTGIRDQIATRLYVEFDNSMNPLGMRYYRDLADVFLGAFSRLVEESRPEKERQFPLAENVLDRVYDSDVTSYNQGVSDTVKAILEKLEAGK